MSKTNIKNWVNMLEEKSKLKLKDGSYIEVSYINHLRSREIAERIINSYLPEEPIREENLDFTNSYKITELQYGSDFYYIIDSLWDYKIMLVHDNSRKIRKIVDEIGDKVIEAMSNYFENGDFNVDYGDVDWYFSGSLKEGVKEGELEIEVEKEKFTISSDIYRDSDGNLNTKVSCSECMDILMKIIEKKFELEKGIVLNFG